MFYIGDGDGNFKYLTNSLSSLDTYSWSTSYDFFHIATNVFNILPEDGLSNYISFNFEIETPKVNPTGTFPINVFYFTLENTYFVGGTNNAYIDPTFTGTSLEGDYNIYGIELLYNKFGIVQPNPIQTEFFAFNPNSEDNTEFLEIEESLIGDDSGILTDGKLQVINTSGDDVDSSAWKVQGSGTSDKILNLQLTEVIQNRLKATPKLNTQIIGDFNFNNTISYDSSNWMLLGGNLSAGSELWNVQFFEINPSTTSINIVDKNNLYQPPIKGVIESNLKLLNDQVSTLAGNSHQYKATTTNNTKTETYINGVNNHRTLLNNNSIVNFKAYAVGVITTGSNKGDVIALEQFGCLKNINKTIALVGTTTSTQKADSGISGGVSLSIEPDSTNQAIKVSVTGDASESMQWKVNIDLAEVSFLDTYNFIFEDGNNVITEASDDLVTELNIN